MECALHTVQCPSPGWCESQPHPFHYRVPTNCQLRMARVDLKFTPHLNECTCSGITRQKPSHFNFYGVFHYIRHLEIWFSPRPLINSNWRNGNGAPCIIRIKNVSDFKATISPCSQLSAEKKRSKLSHVVTELLSFKVGHLILSFSKKISKKLGWW